MRRSQISLLQIAAMDNLALAAYKAARAKRDRVVVKRFFANLHQNLNSLSANILSNKVPKGDFRSFKIYDPKERVIYAACFEDRVLQHAIMNFVAPVLDKAMTTKTFACREGYGVHKAANYALDSVRKYPIYLKLDVKAYFASVSHLILLELLSRKIKGDVLALIEKIIYSYEFEPEYGLPIGALCSQHFANYYLNALDRAFLADKSVKAYCRYMDDMLIFTNTKYEAKRLQKFAENYLWQERDLELKENWQLNKTKYGLTFCGYRVFVGGLGLSLRRKQRYQQRRLYWERLYKEGKISDVELQRNVSAVQSILQGVNTKWQHKNLSLHKAIDA